MIALWCASVSQWGGTVQETLLLRVLIQQSVIVFITEASGVFKLQGFRRENGGNRVPRTRGEHRPRHSRGSPVDVYVRRCVEAERAEQKNYIYTCHSAAERGVHPFQQGRIVENTGKFRHCAATVLLWCRRLSVAAGNAWLSWSYHGGRVIWPVMLQSVFGYLENRGHYIHDKGKI